MSSFLAFFISGLWAAQGQQRATLGHMPRHPHLHAQCLLPGLSRSWPPGQPHPIPSGLCLLGSRCKVPLSYTAVPGTQPPEHPLAYQVPHVRPWACDPLQALQAYGQASSLLVLGPGLYSFPSSSREAFPERAVSLCTLRQPFPVNPASGSSGTEGPPGVLEPGLH